MKSREARPPAAPGRRLAAVPALVALAAIAGCTTNRQIEFAPSTARPTVTVTVTVTGPPSGTSPASTNSGSAQPTSATTTNSDPSPTGVVFNRALADEQYKGLISSIAMIDLQIASGASPALRLDVLSKGFGTLFTLGVPPGLDGPSYLSRLRTLEMFAAAAAQEARANLPRALERYQVVRTETGLLLTQVNGAIRTTYALPSPLKPSTSLTTPPPR